MAVAAPSLHPPPLPPLPRGFQVCEKCGFYHEGCSEHRVLGGGLKPCQRIVRRGQPLCTQHRKLLASKRETRLYANGIPPVGNLGEALHTAVAEVVAFRDYLRGKVADLEQWRYEDAKGAEQLRSEMALYERALQFTVRALIDLSKLGLEERLVRIEEERADLVIAAFREALDVAALPEEVADVIRIDFVRRIQAAAG